MAESILITGANRGIGFSLAHVFVEAGWNVFAGSRRFPSPTLSALAKDHPNLVPLALDVLEPASVASALSIISARTGALDVLVNNAALFPGEGDERFEELDLNWFGETFETNVTGVARVTKFFLPLIRKSERPRIVNISSGAGSISKKDDFRFYPYSVSKAAMNMLTRGLANELTPEGIVVAAISPGWVRTEMGGNEAPLSPKESADDLIKTIETLGPDQSGQFLGRDGRTDDYAW